MTRLDLTYTGPKDSRSLHCWLSKLSNGKYRGSYLVAALIFDEVWVYDCGRKLPSSVYAPTDFPLGYWRSGIHYGWSRSRVEACSRAGLDCKD